MLRLEHRFATLNMDLGTITKPSASTGAAGGDAAFRMLSFSTDSPAGAADETGACASLSSPPPVPNGAARPLGLGAGVPSFPSFSFQTPAPKAGAGVGRRSGGLFGGAGGGVVFDNGSSGGVGGGSGVSMLGGGRGGSSGGGWGGVGIDGGDGSGGEGMFSPPPKPNRRTNSASEGSALRNAGVSGRALHSLQISAQPSRSYLSHIQGILASTAPSKVLKLSHIGSECQTLAIAGRRGSGRVTPAGESPIVHRAWGSVSMMSPGSGGGGGGSGGGGGGGGAGGGADGGVESMFSPSYVQGGSGGRENRSRAAFTPDPKVAVTGRRVGPARYCPPRHRHAR